MARKELNWHDLKAKRNLSISTKLLGMIAGIVFLGTFGATFLTLQIFDHGMTVDVEAGLETTANGISGIFSDWQTSLNSNTALIALNPRIQESVGLNDNRELQTALNERKQNISIGFLAITDKSGKVIQKSGLTYLLSPQSVPLFLALRRRRSILSAISTTRLSLLARVTTAAKSSARFLWE